LQSTIQVHDTGVARVGDAAGRLGILGQLKLDVPLADVGLRGAARQKRRGQ
jgi:hypothetical protein